MARGNAIGRSLSDNRTDKTKQAPNSLLVFSSLFDWETMPKRTLEASTTKTQAVFICGSKLDAPFHQESATVQPQLLLEMQGSTEDQMCLVDFVPYQ